MRAAERIDLFPGPPGPSAERSPASPLQEADRRDRPAPPAPPHGCARAVSGARARAAPCGSPRRRPASGRGRRASTPSMPKKTAVPSACRISAPGPVAITSGTTPRMKAKAVIRIGRRRRRQASTAASTGSCAVAPFELMGELDDQDRVLGREADRARSRPIWVRMLLSWPRSCTPTERRQHASRHHEHDRQRQRPALVLRRQHQEDQHDAEREDVDGGVAGRPLLEGDVRSIRSSCPRAASSRRSPPWRRAPGRWRRRAAASPWIGTE